MEYTFERGILTDPYAGPMWMIIEALFDYQTIEDMVEDKLQIAWSDMVDEDGNLRAKNTLLKPLIFYEQYIDPGY